MSGVGILMLVHVAVCGQRSLHHRSRVTRRSVLLVKCWEDWQRLENKGHVLGKLCRGIYLELVLVRLTSFNLANARISRYKLNIKYIYKI